MSSPTAASSGRTTPRRLRRPASCRPRAQPRIDVQFNPYLFPCFLALVLAVHHAPLPWTARKLALLGFSYAFYAAWDPAFVVLLWGSTVVDWFVARAMMRTGRPALRRALLGASLV